MTKERAQELLLKERRIVSRLIELDAPQIIIDKAKLKEEKDAFEALKGQARSKMK